MADARAWSRLAIVWAARLGAAATFVVAAVPKADDLVGFAEDIRNYQAFPDWSLYAIAAIVPMLELVGAAALLSTRERWVRAGGVVLGGLTLAFIALIASVIGRGRRRGPGHVEAGSQARDPEAERADAEQDRVAG